MSKAKTKDTAVVDNIFTLEVVKSSLIAIGEEMFYTLGRTSMSPIIYEVLDYACGLTDGKGQLLTQGNGVTGFIGILSTMVKKAVEDQSDENPLKPGDIIICNDPYSGGGTHLSDVGLIMPVFYEGELIAFCANKAHWTEVGGKDPGSWTTDSTEIFQEGLQLPPIKLYEEGRLNQAVVEIIRSNVRFPQLSLGDMWAQVAALKTGEKRFVELCEKHGKKVVKASIDYILKHGEQMAKNELQKLPKGTFEAEDFIDDDGFDDTPLPVKCKVTITDEEFIVDFTGTHPQVKGPINCTYAGLVSAVRTVFLAATNPSQDINEGVFHPLKVIAEEGSIINAKRPAPVSVYWETMIFAADVLWKALAPVIPNRLTAGCLTSVCSPIVGGVNPDTGEDFLIVEPSVGGWGAGSDFDGLNGQFCIGDGETYNVPIEVAEKRYGVMVDEYSLNTLGVGSGEYRGGCGVIRSYRALSDGQFVTASFGRHKYAPWGVADGQKGSCNYVEIVRVDGTKQGPYGKCARIPLNTGDVVRFITGTGGGYGDPLNRDPVKVASDVRNEFITVDQAKEIYGVIINPGSFEVEGFTPKRR